MTIHPNALTVAVSSAKGGAGKTTTVVALARHLAAAGRKVAVVDLDVSDPNLHLVAGVDGATPVTVDGDDVTLVTPRDDAGVAVLSPLGFEKLPSSGSLVKLAGYLDAETIVFDLPPGIESQHSELMGAGVRAWVVVAPPTEVGLVGHVAHVEALTTTLRDGALDRMARLREDRRRRFVVPELSWASLETCGWHLGRLDGELVSVRRFDAVDDPAPFFAHDTVEHLGSVGAGTAADLASDDGIAAAAKWLGTLDAEG